MKKIFTFIALSILIVSCKKDEPNNSGSTGLFDINNNTSQNTLRIQTSSDVEIYPIVSYGKQTGFRGYSEDFSSEYNMELIATVASPESQGSTLQASHISFNNTLVYVSYNTQGSVYLGGIDVIDVTSPENPIILQSSVLKNAEISAILYNNEKLYFAGARDVDAFSDVSSPAFVGMMTLNNGRLTNDVVIQEIGGYVANSVYILDDKLYVSSGNTNGGVYILDKNTLNTIEQLNYDGVKDVTSNSTNLIAMEGVYTGSNSQSLKLFSNVTGEFNKSIDLPRGISADAKSNIAIYNDNAVVANGYDGVGYWNLTSGNLYDRVGLPDSMPDYDSLDIYTNAVSYDNNYVYAANGAAGLMVTQINTSNIFEILGKADIEGSVNYVASNNDYIYAASGNKGLKILRLSKKDSGPVVIACESRPVMQSNPNGTYIVNSNEQQYYRSPGNNGNTQLGSMNINSNGLFDYCGRVRFKQTVIIDGTFYIRGNLEINGDLIINSNGRLIIDGGVVIDKNLMFNGTIEFATASSFQVKGNINKNSGATVVNPQLNNGPTIIP